MTFEVLTPMHILASVDWNRDGSSVWMAHHVVAAASPSDREAELLQSLKYLCSRHRRHAARHKAGNYQLRWSHVVAWMPEAEAHEWRPVTEVGFYHQKF